MELSETFWLQAVEVHQTCKTPNQINDFDITSAQNKHIEIGAL